MAARYGKGQKVIITPAKNQCFSPRDSDISTYAGKSGRVTDYYWLSTHSSEDFYIYTVRLEADDKDIVLHEDEIQAHVG